jgi:hypothetical protein
MIRIARGTFSRHETENQVAKHTTMGNRNSRRAFSYFKYAAVIFLLAGALCWRLSDAKSFTRPLPWPFADLYSRLGKAGTVACMAAGGLLLCVFGIRSLISGKAESSERDAR